MTKWMVSATLNYDAYETDYDTQGPWTLEEVNAFVKLCADTKPTSMVLTLVPKDARRNGVCP